MKLPTPNIYDDARDVARFLWKHYPPTRNWMDPVGCIAWYISYGFLGMLKNDSGRIQAVWVGRPVKKSIDGEKPWNYCELGQCIFMDLVVIKDAPLALSGVALMVRARFGHRFWMAYHRRNEKRIRTVGYSQIINRAIGAGIESLKGQTA